MLANPARLAAVAREHGSLAKLATKYRRFKKLNAQIREAMEMVEGDDPDMRELAEAELPELKAEREELWNELLDMTIGGEDANRTRCIMEIRAGTGGDEAALFARDLYEMYKHYAEDQGLEGRGPRHESRPSWAASRKSSSASKARASTASCSSKAAATASSACPRPRPRAASTPRPPPWP